MDDSKSETPNANGTSEGRNNHRNASGEKGAAERALLENGTDRAYVVDKSQVSCRRLFRSGRACLMASLVGVIAAVTALFVTFFLGKWSATGTSAAAAACGNYAMMTPSTANVTSSSTDIDRTSTIRRILPVVGPPTGGTPIVRLTNAVIPIHYDLFTDLRYLHERRYTGSVSIRLKCNNDTDHFMVHVGNEITLDTVELFEIDAAINGSRRKEKLTNVKWTRNSKLPLLTLRFSNENASGLMSHRSLYLLKIEFFVTICGERSGFVCGNGNNNELVDGPERMFVATKFEPNFARTAFPCFDDPQFKATFNWSVVRTRETTVLTNTPSLKKTRQGKGDILEQFEQTPPMSAYLFAILAAPLVSQEARTNRGIRIAVWTKPEDKKRARFALTYAVHVFNSIENYFMINYPMAKLDLVALDYYPVGGMENWGLIMFHNQMLLYSDETTETTPTDGKRLASKFKVAHIIAHELLHQWFGNLVTMRWWSDLWLNEGFAMFYLHYFIKSDFDQLSEFHSFWKLSQTWTRQTQLPDSDQRPPLIRNFVYEESIADAFDEWNLYAKGSAMVKLLWDLLGETSLRGGLINYLKGNAYKSVALEELWENLGQKYHGEDKVSLGRIMKNWLTNPGFPELHVIRDYSSGDVHVQQRLADLENNLVYWNSTKIHNNFTWSIPVAYIVQENLVANQPTGIPFWLHNKSDTFNDHTLTANQWLLVNPNFQFPYRINYDLSNWELLVKQLIKNHESISAKSRTQLILDASYFLRETDNIRIFIELLSYLKRETELLPTLMGLQEMFALFDAYKASSLYPYLIVYFRPVVVQMTNLREEAKNDPELDAIWNLDQSFDLTLRLLQCVTNHQKCHIEKEEVQGFLTLPLSTDSGKLAMVCQYLYRKAESADKAELLRWLEQTASRRGDIVLLTGCVRDRKLNRRMVSILIEKNNDKLLGSAIAGAFSLSYNAIVHQEIWTQLSVLGNDRLIELFKDNPILQRMMIRHVGSLSELTLARKAFGVFASDLNYVEAALEWRQQIVPKLEQWLMEELNIL